MLLVLLTLISIQVYSDVYTSSESGHFFLDIFFLGLERYFVYIVSFSGTRKIFYYNTYIPSQGKTDIFCEMVKEVVLKV